MLEIDIITPLEVVSHAEVRNSLIEKTGNFTTHESFVSTT